MSSQPDYKILHAPRISVAGFVAILSHAGSPARSEARACFAAFTAAGVDPAVGLAIFAKESTYGLYGRAHANRSWGNLRDPDRDGHPYPIDDGAFRRYPTWTAGARDAARLLRIYGLNLIRKGVNTSTVQTMPYVWAPAADGNAPDRYGDQLAAWITQWRARYPFTAPPKGVRHHRVQPGETLSSIAVHYRLRAHAGVPAWRRLYLYLDNDRIIGHDPNLIHPGQLLSIPPA